MLLDFINIPRLRKAIIYFAVMLLTLLLQNTLLSRIEIFGVKAMMLPITAVAVGFFEGGVVQIGGDHFQRAGITCGSDDERADGAGAGDQAGKGGQD